MKERARVCVALGIHLDANNTKAEETELFCISQVFNILFNHCFMNIYTIYVT